MKNSGFRGRDWLKVDSTAGFVSLIFWRPKGSIQRVNFVTHGASDEMGLTGTVEPGSVSFTDGLDEAELDGFRANGIQNDDGTVTPWSEVQARFAPGAQIVVYACKAARDQVFLQYLADTFGVTVKAFTTKAAPPLRLPRARPRQRARAPAEAHRRRGERYHHPEAQCRG